MNTEGPDVRLTAQAGSTLAIALHELATNAAKYGALASPGGRIQLVWRLVKSDRVEFVWSETSDPPRPAVIGEGFGTGFIKRSIEYEMQGEVSVEPTAEGLRWTIVFPLQGNLQDR